MIKILQKYYYLFYLFFLLINTIINISNSDFTSNIDFDLTVIFNSIQIYSGHFQDYRDHPGFTQFLIFGFFYKILSVISFFEIDIYNFLNSENLYNKINYIYYLFKFVNCLIIFLFIIFFNKILNFFFIDRVAAFALSFCILLSSSTFFNIWMLRADIFSFLFFLITFYFFLIFIKKPSLFKIIIISCSTILALLSKIQIIILYLNLLFLIPFFIKHEISNLKSIEKVIKNSFINKYFKIILFSLIILFVIFHIGLNNLPNSRFAEKKYLDLICFFLIFIVYYLYLKLFFKTIINKLLKIYIFIIVFSVLFLLFLNFLSLINLIKLSPYILLRISNPFYYMSVYATNHGNLVYHEIIKVITSYTFKINHYVFLITLISIIFSFIYEKNYKYRLYSILFLICFLSLNFFYNFRYHETYGISLLLYLFLSLYFSLNYINIKFKWVIYFLFLVFFSIHENSNINQKNLFLKTNMTRVCLDNEIKNFYWWWARGLNDIFFKKICEENKLTYKKFLKPIN